MLRSRKKQEIVGERLRKFIEHFCEDELWFL